MATAGRRIAIAVALSVMAAGCGGGGSAGTPTYRGHSRAATVLLAVTASTPHSTAWELSFEFTPAGEPLWQKVKRLSHLDPSRSAQLVAFCTSGRFTADAAIGSDSLGNRLLRVTVFHDLPTPKRWACGLRGARSPESPRRALLSQALLAVTLTGR